MQNQVDNNFLKLHKLGLIKPLARTSSTVRKKIIKSAGYNIGLVPNQLVYIDLLTDSLMHFILQEKSFFIKSSVEASYLNLTDTFKKYFGYSYVLPIAQGRMAEILLAKIMVKGGMAVPSNMLFTTTRLHQELNGATVLEVPVKEAYDMNSDFLFKGNIDTGALEQVILEYGAEWIPYIYVEVCVNASGGHPVSMENIKEVNRIAKSYKIPVILDACRILENAYLIKEREKGYGDKSVPDIVREFCSFSDGCTMSATKDFFVETGGFLATNNQEIYYQAQDAVLAFGDGLSIRAKAILNDVVDQTFRNEDWVRERLEKVSCLWDKLKRFGLPVVNPVGGHGVFLDASDLYKTISPERYPEKAFLAHLYMIYGIRAGENMLTPFQGNNNVKMLRLAIPARMYSLAQMDYVAKSIKDMWDKKEKIKGLKKTYQPPSLTGSFFAKYELVQK